MKSPIDRIFPVDEAVSEIDHLTLGLEDYSRDGMATELLGQLSDRERKAIHRFAMTEVFDIIAHAPHITGLIKGLDERDPERNSEEAVALALAEIDQSRAIFEAHLQHDILPVVVYVADDETPDNAQPVWATKSTMSEAAKASRLLADLECVERYLTEPTPENHIAYNRTMLAIVGSVHAIVRISAESVL